MSHSEKAVLVVEDDRGISRILGMALREAGLSVRTAVTGQQALDLLDQKEEGAVVLDLGLPDKKGGEVLKWLRNHDRTGPVWVVISALNREDAVERYGPIGPNFLPKPFDPWRLVGLIEKLLAERRSEKESEEAQSDTGI